MPRLRFPSLALAVGLAVLLTHPLSATIPDPEDQTADQRAVLAADAQQRLAVASVDLAAIERISDPHLRVNAPNNRILTREDLIRMVASGEIRNEVFGNSRRGGHYRQRRSGNGSRSRLSRICKRAGAEYGRKTLNRRYTNIDVRSGEGWLHLARHANVVRNEPAP